MDDNGLVQQNAAAYGALFKQARESRVQASLL
jgi:hypothetical protein